MIIREQSRSANTYNDFSRMSGVKIGDRLRRSPCPDTGSKMIPCRVVELSERWFRVVRETTGVSECFFYDDLLKKREIKP